MAALKLCTQSFSQEMAKGTNKQQKWSSAILHRKQSPDFVLIQALKSSHSNNILYQIRWTKNPDADLCVPIFLGLISWSNLQSILLKCIYYVSGCSPFLLLSDPNDMNQYFCVWCFHVLSRCRESEISWKGGAEAKNGSNRVQEGLKSYSLLFPQTLKHPHFFFFF